MLDLWKFLLMYKNDYKGRSIPDEEIPDYQIRAQAQIDRYKRIYTVTAPEGAEESGRESGISNYSENMAVCAVADAMYYYDTMANTPQSSSIGSVSSSRGTVDVSDKAQQRAFFRAASTYLDIYRGCR